MKKLTELLKEIEQDKVYGGMSQDRGDTGSSIQFKITGDTPDYFIIDYTISPNSRYNASSSRSRTFREKQSGSTKISKANFNGWIKVNGENFYLGKDFITNNLGENELKENITNPLLSVGDIVKVVSKLGGLSRIIDNPDQYLKPGSLYLIKKIDKDFYAFETLLNKEVFYHSINWIDKQIEDGKIEYRSTNFNKKSKFDDDYESDGLSGFRGNFNFDDDHKSDGLSGFRG